MAISGETAVVGASYESSSSTAVNGDESNNSASRAGAAYVFVRTGNAWSQQAYLKASNTDEYDGFGNQVAIAGETVVVCADGESSDADGVNVDQADNSCLWRQARPMSFQVLGWSPSTPKRSAYLHCACFKTQLNPATSPSWEIRVWRYPWSFLTVVAVLSLLNDCIR
ncbi:MAG: FG-GAP repeat protein [Flavobacteriales bacterium]|nr:FG-GAP repeat protein [Flavobacteriales bacterium]